MIVTRFLYILVLVLTLLMGAVFVQQVFHTHSIISMQSSVAMQHPFEDPELISFDQVATGILSRLSLFPHSTQERSLIAVMIENHEDARPYQEGLNDALLIEECMVEGYISRFVALFDINDLPASIGPVRSLRPYFIDGVLPWTNTILHAGGSPEALERVKEDSLIRSLNGLGLPDHFLRKNGIPAPHNLYINRSHVQDLVTEDDLRLVEWPPYRLGSGTGAAATDIRINFYSPVHNVHFTYNRFVGSYERINGDLVSEAHPRNVLILEAPIEGVGEFGRLDIPLEGRGKAVLFRSGMVQEGWWIKRDSASAFRFEDENGVELPFAKGQTWITVIPTMERVSWE